MIWAASLCKQRLPIVGYHVLLALSFLVYNIVISGVSFNFLFGQLAVLNLLDISVSCHFNIVVFFAVGGFMQFVLRKIRNNEKLIEIIVQSSLWSGLGLL